MTSVAGGILRLTVDRVGSAAVIRFSGELDLSEVPTIQSVVSSLEPYDDLVFDLSKLTFMDSTGLHLCVDTYARAQAEGFGFALAGATAEVARLLEISGLDTVLPLAPDVVSVLATTEQANVA